jgi:hypothetical protein
VKEHSLQSGTITKVWEMYCDGYANHALTKAGYFCMFVSRPQKRPLSVPAVLSDVRRASASKTNARIIILIHYCPPAPSQYTASFAIEALVWRTTSLKDG